MGRKSEVAFGIFSVLATQVNVVESYLDIYLFDVSYDKKCNNCDNLGLEIKVLPIFRLYQKDIPTICLMLLQLNLYVLLVCGKIVMVEIFLLNVFGESKCMTKWQ